jgi:2-hydroxy-6-oxonona-2,4-dienedioate hydrolase
MTSMWNHLQGVAFRQNYIDVQGCKIRAIEAGEGPPLILLHGTGGHAEAYIKNIRAHAEHFHVYAIDMIGHGYSSAPDIDYDMQTYVDFIRDFLDAIGAERAYISGESLGASVAAWFAIQHPHRVTKIVMNTGTLLPPDEAGAKDLRELLERSKRAAGEPSLDTVRQRMRWLVHDENSLTDELVEARYRIYSQPGRAAILGGITARSLGALLDPEEQRKWYSAVLLQQIQCPTLMLWTRYNPGQSVELAQESLLSIPDGELALLEHSGHWPQWEEPREFDRLHLQFLLKP